MPLSLRACRGGGLSRSPTVSPSRTFFFSSSSCAGCQPHRNARSLRPYFSSGSASSIFSPQQCFGRSWLTFSHQSKPNDFSDLLLWADRLAESLVVWSLVRWLESSAPDSSFSSQRSCWRLRRNVCVDFPPTSRLQGKLPASQGRHRRPLQCRNRQRSNRSAANSGKARRTLFDLPTYLVWRGFS